MRHGVVMLCDVHTRPLKDQEAVQTETDETDKTLQGAELRGIERSVYSGLGLRRDVRLWREAAWRQPAPSLGLGQASAHRVCTHTRSHIPCRLAAATHRTHVLHLRTLHRPHLTRRTPVEERSDARP